MMDNLRTAANSVVLKIIFGIIIVSFILTGVSGYLIGGGKNYAAKVNGQEIGRGQFENAVASERNRMQQQLGDQFSELAANENYMKTMRQQVLNRLIDESLLDQYARELGLSISDEQVKQAIFQTQAFQTNGKFDNQRFSGIVAQMGMTTDQYAQALRNQLTTQQLINAIAGTDFMLPGESDQLAALVSQQRVVREATINVNALAAKQTASDEEINAFWQQNQARFMAPEQFRVSYIKMDAASMQESASDEEIQSWYDQHKDQFTQPQRNRYSVIQTKTEADAKAVLAELQKGADFAALAKEKSTDIISARNGGDMGWMEDASTVPELKAAKDFLQKMAADLNRFNMSSCQAAKAMVDSVASLWGESQQNVCQSVAGQNNVFSDWVSSRQGCTSGGKYESVTNKATGAEKDQVLKDINLMWDALSNSTLSSNAELRQFAMSISGSVIFGSNGEMRILSSLASDRSLLSAMMSGGSAKVYVCDNQNKCLSPSLNNVTISESKSLIRMVEDTLTSIENKAITDTPLTDKEKQFINSTSIPILSWIVDQSSLSVSQSLFAQLTDYIAVDIYLQYLEAVMKVVNGSLATKDYPGANMNELKNGLADARQALNSLRMEVQIKENALISAQQQIRFIRQQLSSKMSDRVLGNYQFSRVN